MLLGMLAMTTRLLLGAAVLAASCGPAFLPAAPAPFYPRDGEVAVSESYLVGTWEVVYGKHKSVATFHPDGKYTCRRDGQEYVGTWLFLRGSLRIEESVPG